MSSGRIFILFLTIFPKTLWSRFLSILVQVRFPRPLNLWIMRTFAKRYNLNLEEAEKPLEEYPTIGALFTRALKEGTHTSYQIVFLPAPIGKR